MRRFVLALCGIAAVLACLAPGLTGPARGLAARAHAAGNPSGAAFMVGTVDGTAYAPKATGAFWASGATGGRLTYVAHLSGLPRPAHLGGRYYKVWLVAPEAALAVPGGALAYHADGTADGTFTSAYHDFTVLAITPEMTPNGSYPRNDKVVEGSVDAAGMQAALSGGAPRLALIHGRPAPASVSRSPRTLAACAGSASSCLQ
ncbi:MAG: hypothetical protein NVSMB65_17700 [Chloroflexota bacterium]